MSAHVEGLSVNPFPSGLVVIFVGMYQLSIDENRYNNFQPIFCQLSGTLGNWVKSGGQAEYLCGGLVCIVEYDDSSRGRRLGLYPHPFTINPCQDRPSYWKDPVGWGFCD